MSWKVEIMQSTHIPLTTAELLSRYKTSLGTARMSRDDLEQAYWSFHPRFRFFKTVPHNAKLLDIGANNGGLAQWRGWGQPERPDISMYGIDLASGEFSHLYAGWESLNLDEAMPSFPGVTFDAILCSHLIEHIERPEELLDWVARKSAPGARLYLEWPNVTTLDLPARSELEAGGWPVMISNFFDDDTHLHLKSLEEISTIVRDCGFDILESGVIDAGDLTGQLIDLGQQFNDPTMTLMGFWSLTHWATYLICERV